MHKVNVNAQPLLPDYDEYKSKVEKTFPQPRVKKFKNIRKFEIIHRPFDLLFRGIVYEWLRNVIEKKGLDFDKILGKDAEIVRLYFFPQGRRKKWITQRTLIKKTGLSHIYKVRPKIVRLLLTLWDKTR